MCAQVSSLSPKTGRLGELGILNSQWETSQVFTVLLTQYILKYGPGLPSIWIHKETSMCLLLNFKQEDNMQAMCVYVLCECVLCIGLEKR